MERTGCAPVRNHLIQTERGQLCPPGNGKRHRIVRTWQSRLRGCNHLTPMERGQPCRWKYERPTAACGLGSPRSRATISCRWSAAALPPCPRFGQYARKEVRLRNPEKAPDFMARGITFPASITQTASPLIRMNAAADPGSGVCASGFRTCLRCGGRRSESETLHIPYLQAKTFAPV